MTWENQLNKSEREYFTEIDVFDCFGYCEVQKETEELRRQKQDSQKKDSSRKTTEKSKKQMAEDLLKSLL